MQNKEKGEKNKEKEVKGKKEMPKAVEPKRVFSKSGFVHTDTFKLLVSTMEIDRGWVQGKPILDKIEHCHHFHTFDSNGRPNKTSVSSGGHCHEVEWWVDDKGEFHGKCGPAMYKPTKAKNGKIFKKVKYFTYDEYGNDKAVYDDHTHDVKYIRSATVEMRKINQEAVTVVSQLNAAFTPKSPGNEAVELTSRR